MVLLHSHTYLHYCLRVLRIHNGLLPAARGKQHLSLLTFHGVFFNVLCALKYLCFVCVCVCLPNRSWEALHQRLRRALVEQAGTLALLMIHSPIQSPLHHFAVCLALLVLIFITGAGVLRPREEHSHEL